MVGIGRTRASVRSSGHRMPELLQMFDADCLDLRDQLLGAFEEPDERFLADVVVLRVAGFDVGLVQNIEPGDVLVLIGLPDVGEPLITALAEAAQVLQIVGGGTVAGQNEQQC